MQKTIAYIVLHSLSIYLRVVNITSTFTQLVHKCAVAVQITAIVLSDQLHQELSVEPIKVQNRCTYFFGIIFTDFSKESSS